MSIVVEIANQQRKRWSMQGNQVAVLDMERNTVSVLGTPDHDSESFRMNKFTRSKGLYAGSIRYGNIASSPDTMLLYISYQGNREQLYVCTHNMPDRPVPCGQRIEGFVFHISLA